MTLVAYQCSRCGRWANVLDSALHGTWKCPYCECGHENVSPHVAMTEKVAAHFTGTKISGATEMKMCPCCGSACLSVDSVFEGRYGCDDCGMVFQIVTDDPHLNIPPAEGVKGGQGRSGGEARATGIVSCVLSLVAVILSAITWAFIMLR